MSTSHTPSQHLFLFVCLLRHFATRRCPAPPCQFHSFPCAPPLTHFTACIALFPSGASRGPPLLWRGQPCLRSCGALYLDGRPPGRRARQPGRPPSGGTMALLSQSTSNCQGASGGDGRRPPRCRPSRLLSFAPCLKSYCHCRWPPIPSLAAHPLLSSPPHLHLAAAPPSCHGIATRASNPPLRPLFGHKN